MVVKRIELSNFILCQISENVINCIFLKMYVWVFYNQMCSVEASIKECYEYVNYLVW